MLTIDPELEMKLKALAEQEHCSPDEIIQRLVNHYLQQKQQSELLADMAEQLPEIACFKQQDPLKTQQALRDEWH
jgi:predicted transcriptional regulator